MNSKHLVIILIILILIVGAGLTFLLLIPTYSAPPPLETILSDSNNFDNNFENEEDSQDDLNITPIETNSVCGDGNCELEEEGICSEDCTVIPPINHQSVPDQDDYCGDKICSESEGKLGNCDSDCQ